MFRRGALFLGAAVFVLVVWEVLPSGQPRAGVSLRASAKVVKLGQRIVLSGGGARGSAAVNLYGRTFPATVGRLLATVRAHSDGSFAFARTPDRDTSYYVQTADGASSIPVLVQVDTRAEVQTRTSAFGQVLVRVRVYHPADLDWDGARVSWAFASGAGSVYKPAPDTRTIRVRQNVDLLTTTATLPPGPFRWRACFDAPGAQELEDPEPVQQCHGQGFSGAGALPREPGGFPTAADIGHAAKYLSTRQGHTALAVVNTNGRVAGVHLDEQFITGSVVKAMLLVAYLRRLNAMGQRVIDSASNALLVPMIELSDNASATHVWDIVGNAGLDAVAKAAGMTHFSPSGGNGFEWAAALITARDQAEFFWEMDSLIPHEFVPYARNLLSHVASFESWGIPAVARPLGYSVFFKAGWRPSPDIFLVHQIARLEKDGHKFAIAVMSDGDPDMTYGIDTIQGTTRALLGLS